MSKDIFDLYQRGDPVAAAIIARYKYYLSIFLGNVVQSFDPHYIVLGGGVSVQGAIYEGFEELLLRQCFIKDTVPPVTRAFFILIQ